jgi:hypothetical protein
VKKIALAVIVASIAVGAVFGLLVQSAASPSRTITFDASIDYSPSGFICPNIGNYTEWLQIFVSGNRTGLNLNTVTVLDPGTRITLTMPLNMTSSEFVAYDEYNQTFEAISVPLPGYWSPRENLDISLSYYFSGLAPSDYTIGLTPIVQEKNMTC